jgi:hypothetical protein
MLSVMAHDLSDAITYEITSEMTDVMQSVYDKSIENTDILQQQEIPTESGFAWYDNGWQQTDRHGQSYTVRAVSWRFADTIPCDFANNPGPAIMCPCVRIALWVHVDDDDPAWSRRFDTPGLGKLQALHTSIIPMNVPLADEGNEDTGAEASAGQFLGMIHLLWMFLGMEIVAQNRTPVPRHFRRRALKSITHGDVHVVLLRRLRHITEPVEGDKQRIDWTCRWVVQGHWRHVHRDGTEPGDHVHRAVVVGMDRHCAVCGSDLAWVRPYLKGPDGRPLRVSHSLMKLAR